MMIFKCLYLFNGPSLRSYFARATAIAAGLCVTGWANTAHAQTQSACAYGPNEFPAFVLGGETPANASRQDAMALVVDRARDKLVEYYYAGSVPNDVNLTPPGLNALLQETGTSGDEARFRFAPFLAASAFEVLVLKPGADDPDAEAQQCFQDMFESYVAWVKQGIHNSKLQAWCTVQFGSNCPLTAPPFAINQTASTSWPSQSELAALRNMVGQAKVSPAAFEAKLTNPLGLGPVGRATYATFYGPAQAAASETSMYSPYGLSGHVLRDNLLPGLFVDRNLTTLVDITNSGSGSNKQVCGEETAKGKQQTALGKLTYQECMGALVGGVVGGSIGGGVTLGVLTKVISDKIRGDIAAQKQPGIRARNDRNAERLARQLARDNCPGNAKRNTVAQGISCFVEAEDYAVTNAEVPVINEEGVTLEGAFEVTAEASAEVEEGYAAATSTFGGEIAEVLEASGVLTPEGLAIAAAALIANLAVEEYNKLTIASYFEHLVARQQGQQARSGPALPHPVSIDALLGENTKDVNRLLAGRASVMNFVIHMLMANPMDRGKPALEWSINPGDIDVTHALNGFVAASGNKLGMYPFQLGSEQAGVKKVVTDDAFKFGKLETFATGARQVLYAGDRYWYWTQDGSGIAKNKIRFDDSVFPVDMDGDGNTEYLVLSFPTLGGQNVNMHFQIFSRDAEGDGYELTWMDTGMKGAPSYSDEMGYDIEPAFLSLAPNGGLTELVHILNNQIQIYAPWPAPKADKTCKGTRAECTGLNIVASSAIDPSGQAASVLKNRARILVGDINGDTYNDLVIVGRAQNNCFGVVAFLRAHSTEKSHLGWQILDVPHKELAPATFASTKGPVLKVCDLNYAEADLVTLSDVDADGSAELLWPMPSTGVGYDIGVASFVSSGAEVTPVLTSNLGTHRVPKAIPPNTQPGKPPTWNKWLPKADGSVVVLQAPASFNKLTDKVSMSILQSDKPNSDVLKLSEIGVWPVAMENKDMRIQNIKWGLTPPTQGTKQLLYMVSGPNYGSDPDNVITNPSDGTKQMTVQMWTAEKFEEVVGQVSQGMKKGLLIENMIPTQSLSWAYDWKW